MMKLRRRRFLHLAEGAAALPAQPPIARAQIYPRVQRVIVGLAAGGSKTEWALPGNIATELVVRAPADGCINSWP